MSAPVRILLIEDSPSDAKLVLRELARLGEIDHRRIEDEPGLRKTLVEHVYDVIVCDWSMPQFDAMGALRVLGELAIDTPLIIASGTIGEELAVQAMRAGASDYVLKDNLTRLVPAIERELREAEERAARRRAEAAVRLEQSRFRALVESSTDGITVITSEGKMLYVSPAVGRILGRSVAELTGSVVLDYFHPDERREASERLRGMPQHPGMSVTVPRRILRPDGTIRRLEVTLTSRIDDPAVQGIVCNVRDVTESDETRRELVTAQTRFARLFESGIIGIVLTGPDGEVVEANDTVLAMIGYSREELAAGQIDWKQLTPPEWREWNVEALDQLAREDLVRPREKEYLRKDGTRVSALVGITRVEANSLLAVWLDLTDIKRTEAALRESEQQLRHAQKMEAVGRLAGGIAHDFNNLLSVILSYAEMTIGDLREGDPMRADIEEIRNAAKRAAGLTRQLLMFSRRQVVESKVFDLNESITRTGGLLKRLLGEDVELVTQLDARQAHIRADPGGIEQVVMNLAVNARDAMPRGGRLIIRTANVQVDAADASAPVGVKPGAYVVLSVEDSGVGMDEATQLRMFEPFFTTKAVGKGTGLGLSTVFGIVEQSSGSIAVESNVGVGTVFRIQFPCADESLEPVHPTPVKTLRRGHETILLVEDDDALRTVVRGILSRAGYVVLDARSSEDALRIGHERTLPIHLLLSDVVMPQMSGPELAFVLNTRRPDMLVLLMSGHTDDDMVRHGVLDGRVAFLQKPLTPESLTRKVREVLDARR